MFDVHVTLPQLMPSLSFCELYESFYASGRILATIQSELEETTKRGQLSSRREAPETLPVFSFPLTEVLCSSASSLQMSKQTEV